jgi:hypothetical protein
VQERTAHSLDVDQNDKQHQAATGSHTGDPGPDAGREASARPSHHLREADPAPQEQIMTARRIVVLTIGLVALGSLASAQSQGTKTTTVTKTEIKGGQDLTVTGCLERGPGTDFFLTVVRQTGERGPTRYSLVTRNDMSKYVGHRVEIRGKAVTDGQGTVTTQTKTKTEVGNNPDQETKTTTEGTSGVLATAFLSVGTIETRSSSCN